MPLFQNTNSHAVRTEDNDGRRRRVRTGEVLSADGAFADRLKAINGVETASKADLETYQKSRQADTGGQDARAPLAAKLGEVRAAAAALLTALDQVVVGDDQAPFGPPTGTITTKQAAGAKEPHAFGTNEAFQSGQVDGEPVTAAAITGSGTITGRDVHVTQAEKQAAQDDAAQTVVSLLGGDAADEPSGDGTDEATEQS
jgi:hypothetical protein